MTSIPQFRLDPEFITSVTIRTEYNRYNKLNDLSDDEMVDLLKNGKPFNAFSISTADHPEFDKLRRRLAAEGFIKPEYGWWNGDQVLVKFKLNDMKFNVGDQFPSGGALGTHIKFLKNHPEYK